MLLREHRGKSPQPDAFRERKQEARKADPDEPSHLEIETRKKGNQEDNVLPCVYGGLSHFRI
jgi:hypothetical protein